MATYTLISSNVLASNAASVTFSAIPATYTDLVLRFSVRSTFAGANIGTYYTLNSDTSSLYSETFMFGTGTTVTSSRNSGVASSVNSTSVNGSTSTASTFTSLELYLPSYTSTTSKPWSLFNAREDNSATVNCIQAMAGLYRNTSAITSITITPTGASSYVTNSSFYLYGISNA